MADDLATRAQRRHRRRRSMIVATVAGALVVVAVAAVVLLVTREDEPASTSTARRRATSTTTSSTTTAPLPSTSIVPAAPDPIVQLAQQYDGLYTGTFNNTTFGTSGPTTLELRIEPSTGDMHVKATFEGDLLGGGAPPPGQIEGTVKLGDPAAAITTDTPSFGPVTGRIDQNLQLVLDAPEVPGVKVQSFNLVGRLNADQTGFDSDYTVTFQDGSTAQGTVALTCAPEGQRPSEVTTLCPAR